MPFSNLLLSLATVGTTTLAFAIATPVSAQQYYPHHHYAHAHYAYGHTHYTTIATTLTRVVISSFTRKNRWSCRPQHAWGPMGGPVSAVGNVVGGTGYAVGRVFTGAGMIVEGRWRRVGRRVGALRRPGRLRIRRSVRCAIQCGGDRGRSAVPGGGRRFRSAAACARQLLSHFQRNTRLHSKLGCDRIIKSSKAGLLDFDVEGSAEVSVGMSALLSRLGSVLIVSRLGSAQSELGPSTRRLLTGS